MKFVSKIDRALKTNNHIDYYENILDIGNGLFAKCTTKDMANHEFNIGNYLFENNVKVPQYLDILDIDGKSFLIMEKIKGTNLQFLDKRFLVDAEHKAAVEILKSLDLGVLVSGSFSGRNSIYTPNKEVFLIDFEKAHFEKDQYYLEFYRGTLQAYINNEIFIPA